MVTSREIRLKSRPVGLPSAENFELATVTVPAPAPGEVQVKSGRLAPSVVAGHHPVVALSVTRTRRRSSR